jgi:hypothetical protein
LALRSGKTNPDAHQDTLLLSVDHYEDPYSLENQNERFLAFSQ